MQVKKLRCYIEIRRWEIGRAHNGLKEPNHWSRPYTRKFKTLGERNSWWHKHKQSILEALAPDGHPLHSVKLIP